MPEVQQNRRLHFSQISAKSLQDHLVEEKGLSPTIQWKWDTLLFSRRGRDGI
jgi:hypothetical protein